MGGEETRRRSSEVGSRQMRNGRVKQQRVKVRG